MMITSNTVHKDKSDCVFGTFSGNGLMEILRALIFIIIVKICTKDYYNLFPLPFTWIFNDFSKFVFEPMCIPIFCNYLNIMEPENAGYLEQLMKLYLTSYQTTRKTAEGFEELSGELLRNDSTSKHAFEVYLQKLYPSYKRFQGTISYLALYRKVREFEEITEKIYG